MLAAPRPSPKPHRSPEPSAIVGESASHPVSVGNGSKITSKITIKTPEPERIARLHLWLGEYKLAELEDPTAAYYRFRTM